MRTIFEMISCMVDFFKVSGAIQNDRKCTSFTLKQFLPALVLKRNIKVSSVSLKF